MVSERWPLLESVEVPRSRASALEILVHLKCLEIGVVGDLHTDNQNHRFTAGGSLAIDPNGTGGECSAYWG